MKLRVEKLVAGGLGLARHNGEILLLPGTLPGEEVLAEPGELVRGVRRARVVEIMAASPVRVEPDCHLAGRCGGCDFLHVRPAEALRLKSEAALGELAHQAGIEIELIQSPLAAHYRGRATVHLDRRDDGVFGVGFYDHRRRLVEFDNCLLLAPELNGLMAPLRQWAAGLPAAADSAEISLLKGEADSGLAVHFSPRPSLGQAGRGRRPQGSVLAPALLKVLGDLPPLLAARGGPKVAVYARSGERGRPRKISPGGPQRLPVAVWPELGLTLCAAPGGFTQVNPAVNILMVKKILESAAPLAAGTKMWKQFGPSSAEPDEPNHNCGGVKPLRGTASALDLYSGLGNIALPLLKSGFAVTAVEESPDGAAAARENGRGLAGLTVIAERSETAAAQLARQGRRFSLVVLDPPRSGAKDLAPSVAALEPEMIIYVACHPAVLGRDLPAFASLGYGLRSLTTLDMFPRTSHLEALAVLERF